MAKKRIKDLGVTATAADLKTGNYLGLDGDGGSKKVPIKDLIYFSEYAIESLLEYGVGYVTNVGDALEKVVVDNTQCALIFKVSNNDIVRISGKPGVTRAWAKLLNGVVTEIADNSTLYKSIEVVCDGTFDGLCLNFRNANDYPPAISVISDNKFYSDILYKMLEEKHDEIELEVDGIKRVSIDLAGYAVNGLQYNTTEGQPPTLFSRNASDACCVIVDNLVQGDVVYIGGMAGVSRGWAKVSNGIVTEVFYNTTVYTQKAIVCDGTFDGLCLNFRNITENEVSVSKSSQINTALEIEIGRVERLEKQVSENAKRLSVLLIGSSFGVNTFCQFPALCDASGIDIIGGNLYQGGATLADVKANIESDATFDSGRIWDSVHKSWQNVTAKVSSMLSNYTWDCIILQRAAPGKEGGSDTWTASMAEDLDYILDYIRNHTHNNPKIYFNSVFGRSQHAYSGSREEERSKALLVQSTAMQMQAYFGIEVLPSAIAVANARETSLRNVPTSGFETDPALTGQGEHLDTGIGSYVLGCTLFEMICGQKYNRSILELDYLPTIADVTNNGCFDDQYFTQITEEQAKIARYCAMCAVRNPNAIRGL